MPPRSAWRRVYAVPALPLMNTRAPTRVGPWLPRSRSLFFFNDPATTEFYTLSLHDALPIHASVLPANHPPAPPADLNLLDPRRSEEHTSELQSRVDLVCRLLLEKKKKH